MKYSKYTPIQDIEKMNGNTLMALLPLSFLISNGRKIIHIDFLNKTYISPCFIFWMYTIKDFAASK